MTNIDTSTSRSLALQDIEERFRNRFGKSKEAIQKGNAYFPNQIAQSTRISWPWNPVQSQGKGAIITTVDGVDLIDQWLGHFCILLGHDSEKIRLPIEQAIHDGNFFQSGYVTRIEAKLAEKILQISGDTQIAFGSSGAQMTAAAIMLGLRKTNRPKVLKIHGGFHGVQPWAMVGVRTAGPDAGGLPPGVVESVNLVNLNDLEALEHYFKKSGSKTAVVITELALVNAGIQMAHPSFIKRLRELTLEYGVVLVFDEIITGFRVHGGSLSSPYGIRPDLTTWGKVISGGMPFSCLTGSTEVMQYMRLDNTLRVWGDNGTFTAHPGSLTAAYAIASYVTSSEATNSYSKMNQQFRELRNGIKSLLSELGVQATVTGESPEASIPDMPIGAIHFTQDNDYWNVSPAARHWNPKFSDQELRDKILKPLLILEGVYPWQGLGGLSFAHNDTLVKNVLNAYRTALTEISMKSLQSSAP